MRCAVARTCANNVANTIKDGNADRDRLVANADRDRYAIANADRNRYAVANSDRDLFTHAFKIANDRDRHAVANADRDRYTHAVEVANADSNLHRFTHKNPLPRAAWLLLQPGGC